MVAAVAPPATVSGAQPIDFFGCAVQRRARFGFGDVLLLLRPLFRRSRRRNSLIDLALCKERA